MDIAVEDNPGRKLGHLLYKNFSRNYRTRMIKNTNTNETKKSAVPTKIKLVISDEPEEEGEIPDVEKMEKKSEEEEEEEEEEKEKTPEEDDDADEDENDDDDNDEQTKSKTPEKEEGFSLQLGDVIQVIRSVYKRESEDVPEKTEIETFLIDYIDQSKIKLINTDSLEKSVLNIRSDNSLSDETIQGINLIQRQEYPGYAKQNGLLTGTWVNIFFGGDVPSIITGEITNLEEDMIELKLHPSDEIIYINFDYKGIPENLPIENIEIRPAPESIKKELKEREASSLVQEESDSLEPGEIREEKPGTSAAIEAMNADDQLYDVLEEPSIKDNIRKFILEADEIEFGSGDEFGSITQYVEKEQSKQRYSIEMQTNDLLNDLLSTVPSAQRTPTVLYAIHTTIERFKQLRNQFSTFDNSRNVEGPLLKRANWRPLVNEMIHLQKQLYWLLPVVKNVKKLYGTLLTNSDIQIMNDFEELNKMQQAIESYKTNNSPDEQNKYASLIHELNPLLTPFESIDPEQINEIINEKSVSVDLACILDNLDDFYSSVANVEAKGSFSQREDTKRFAFQMYNVGLDKLVAKQFTGGRMISERAKLTQNEEVALKSWMTLPEPVVYFSRINLHSASLLERSNMNQVFLNYWKLLKKNTNVNTVVVENGKNFDENFLKDVTNYICPAECDYPSYLKQIVPDTQRLFQLMQKYINNRETKTISFVDFVNQLEPFMVYSQDITYDQYKEINKYSREKINYFNKRFVERDRAFVSLKILKVAQINNGNRPNFLCNILADQTVKEEVFQQGYECHADYTNSEMLNKIMQRDSGKLFNSAISSETSGLMLSQNMTSFFEQDKDKKDGKGEDGECASFVLAKQYTNAEDLKNDNDKEIYFDKRFDKTQYSILDEHDYQMQMVKMPSDEFVDYLVAQLQKKQRLNQEDAMYLADTLITGAKKVIDGQYAFIFDIGNMDNLTYYKRINGKWVLDESVDKSFFINDSNLLCDMQKNCITLANKCETVEANKHTLKHNGLEEIMKEFDEKYALSKQELEEKIKKEFEYNVANLEKLKKMEYSKKLKYNNAQFSLGMGVSEDAFSQVVSPYYNLRELILGQTDFVKKQQDVIKFTMAFTRESMGTDEDINWRYCIKTGVKLLPAFIYTMASYFINDPENYNNHIDYLIKNIGKTSDDGNAWVDKNSGYIIRLIDLDTEEGFDDGFKVVSREIMEQDAANLIKAPKFERAETKMCFNIVDAFASAMGIKLDEHKEFIAKHATTITAQIMPTESAYKKQVQEIEKKGKTAPPSYKDLHNSSILYLTMGMILIAIQTSIPEIKTRRTFPGCVRSFSGFPMEGAGDDSSVHYISCIAYKIRIPTDPWNILMKKKEIFIAERLKDYIQKNLLGISEIHRKFEEKADYLLSNPIKDIPSEHSLDLVWKQFLPPLVSFKITNLTNITTEFKSKLLKDLKSGYKGQQESLAVVQSKIIFFSLRLQERIQHVLKNERALLTNMANEPFLENACCNKSVSAKTTLDYFIEKDSEIETCNNIVNELSKTLEDVTFLSRASMFYSAQNTKNIYPGVVNEFNEETIYKAFIVFCRFNSLIPMNQELAPLCNEKPDYFSSNDSVQEMIKKLKTNGKIYTNELLLRLLQIVGRNKLINVITDSPVIDNVERIRDVIESISEQDEDDEGEELIDKTLQKLLKNNLDTFDLALKEDTKEMRSLKNHLARTNREIRGELLEFIKKNNNLIDGKKNQNIAEHFLNGLMNWGKDPSDEDDDEKENENDEIGDDNGFNSIEFVKTYLDKLVHVFPSIINHQVDYENINIPKYWGVSGYHAMDIKKFVGEYYKDLRYFYRDTTLQNILTTIQKKCKNLMLLSKNTPYFTKVDKNGEGFYSVFDKRISLLLYEQYFLLVLLEYKNLSENSSMLFSEKMEEEKLENIFDVEDYDEGLDPTISLQREGSVQRLKTTVANLLMTYIKIMNDHKGSVDRSYEYIMDKAFKSQEKEKDTFTDRLKALTDEQRNVDTVLKANKLGVWGKGLQKGLTVYDPNAYDEEREILEKVAKAEKDLRQMNVEVNQMNIDELFEDMAREQEIEYGAYDMRQMNDDYDDGNFEAEEVDNQDDYN